MANLPVPGKSMVWRAITAVLWLCLSLSANAQTASLLPNGEQTFVDANGAPYAGGTVCYYIPTTLTPKQTWLDPNQVTPHTIPCVTLDSAGRTIVYGSGQYRQILKDSLGNTIWDQLTDDVLGTITGIVNSFWGGTSAGTANAQTITVSGVTTPSTGNVFWFIAGQGNTSTAPTLKVNASTPATIMLRTSGGLVSLPPNYLVSGVVFSATFDGTSFELNSPANPTGVIGTVASNTTTDLGSVSQQSLNVTGTTTITSFGSSAVIGDIKFVQFSGALTITNNATSLILPGGANILTTTGATALFRYEGSGNWRGLYYGTGVLAAGRSNSGLVIVNDTGTPNTQIDITCAACVLANSAGTGTVLFNTVAVTIDLTTGTSVSTPNGMDGEAIPANGWLAIYLISNGSVVAGLASNVSLTLPTGYTQYSRVGYMRTASSILMRTKQLGSRAQYTVVAATNTATAQIVASGHPGGYTTPTWTAISVSGVVPATARSIIGEALCPTNGTAIVAPNNAYGVWTSTSNPPPVVCYGGATASTQLGTPFSFLLESANIYWATDASATNLVTVLGWEDNL